MNKIVTVIGTVLILTACTEETKTVQWYKDHPEVLAKEFEKCKIKTPAELAVDKHCAVIREAQEQAFDDHQQNAPLPNLKFKLNEEDY